MAESSSLSVFRVTRIIRRPKAIGALVARAETGGRVDPMSALHMATMIPMLAAAPELIPIFGLIAAGSYLQSFYQPGLGRLVLPTNIYRPWEYADQIQRLMLEKHYGRDEGDKVYTVQFSQRAIEVDLRSRSP
jgi:hypothetical protein